MGIVARVLVCMHVSYVVLSIQVLTAPTIALPDRCIRVFRSIDFVMFRRACNFANGHFCVVCRLRTNDRANSATVSALHACPFQFGNSLQ